MDKKLNVVDRGRARLLLTRIIAAIVFLYCCTQMFSFNYHYQFPTNDNSFQVLHDMRVKDGKEFDRVPTLHPDESHLHIGTKAMVSSDSPVCSTMGKEILLKGGNSADAAVTVALCIGTIFSGSSGVGGGGFIVSSDNVTKEVLSIDAREAAPGKAFTDMFEKNPLLSVVGGLSSGIPGELKGLDYLFHNHGSGNLTWYEVIEPVIKLNREGFTVPTVLAAQIAALETRYFSIIPEFKKNWDFIYNEDGSTKKEGDIVKRPNFADTLELIGKNGSLDIFYDPKGPIASSLIEINKAFGGLYQESDFEKYHVNVENALNLKITDEYEIFTSSGISSGLVLLSGLNLFRKLYNVKDESYLLFHKVIETMKWMASVRTRLGDNNEAKTYANLVQQYTSEEWSQNIINSKYSDEQTFRWEHYDPLYEQSEPHGTSHFSILDANDNAVAMTTTINLLFGSIVYDPVTGIILNNEMDDFLTKSYNNSFGLAPSRFNLVKPYKRPLSSTAPTIIMRNGIPDMVIGAAGGSRITTAIFMAIVRIYQLGQNLLESISFPRFHDQLIPDYTLMENMELFKEEFGYPVVEKLKSIGHKFNQTGVETSMNGIKRFNGEIHGVSDYWRKLAESDGY